ncbi:HDIG domain-containing metalloprotein [Mycoplasmoides pirum]|uniref:HDIG domain-containing metalloprotein n=1 Tax=Mycoplasmoides pirum TaxID=2122 RepID=UPI000696AB98|nr:HDIG domain-containing metalloprotein [Mycoplasmoides pirum]
MLSIKEPIIFYLILAISIIIVVLLFLIIIFAIYLKKQNHKDNFKKEKKIKIKKNKKHFSKSNQNFDVENNLIKNENEIKELNFLNNFKNESFYQLNKYIEDIKDMKTNLLHLQQKYIDAIKKTELIMEEENLKLSKLTNLSIDDAKNLLLNNVYKKIRTNLNEIYLNEKNNFDNDINLHAQNLLINAMEVMAEKTITQRSLTTIPIKDENLKGKIIGKHGRNKHLFESLTGTDIIVEKNAEVTISSPNPIRREIAVNLFNAMIESKVIDPGKLENLYVLVKNDFENRLYDFGKKVLETKLKIFDVDPRIYPYVGRLKYRTSYGQNVLDHCIEAAKYAEIIAKEIKIDSEKAKRAAFFHDIGKAIDFDENYDHVESGLKIAKICYLPEYIYNAIESHHNQIEPNNIYAALVKVVDTLSAARPGARIDSLNDFIKRVNHLEETCKSISGVKEAYAVQSGRTLRIIIEPDIVPENTLDILQYEIKQAIENDDLLNKHQLKIILIREKRFEFFANRKTNINNAFESKEI